MIAGSIEVQMSADIARLRRDMGEARTVLGSVSDSAERIGNALRGMLAGLSLAYLAREFVQAADAMQTLNARLKLATTSQADFAAAQADVYRISQANNVGLQETATLYARLADPVRKLGGGMRETADITEAMATALRISGASGAEASSAILQFSQAMASGTLRGEEFNAVNEAAPRIMTALEAGLGKTRGELRKMAEAGQLTADVVGNALIGQLGKLKTEAAGLPDTVGGAWQRLKNDVMVAVDAFNTATDASGGLAGIIGGVADLVHALTQSFKVGLTPATGQAADSFDTVGAAIGTIGTGIEAFIVLVSDVMFVLKGMGREIGGLAAQAVAFASGNWSEVGAISEQMRADAEKARAELDKFQGAIVGTTDRVMQARDAQRQHGLAAADNANELRRLSGRVAETNTAKLKLKTTTKELTAEQKKVADATREYIRALDQQVQVTQIELQQGYALTDQQKAQMDLERQLADGKIKLTAEQRKEVEAKLAAIAANREAARAAEEYRKTLAEVAKHASKAAEEEAAVTDKLRDQVVALIDQNDKLRLGEEAFDARAVAQMRAQATELEWTAAMQGGNFQLEEQARLLRQRADLMEEGVALREAKAVADEWKKTTESIQQGLTDSLFRAFEAGKGFFSTLWDGIKNTLKTTMLRVGIDAFMKPVSGALGALFGTGSAMAGTSAEGGAGLLGSLFSGLGSFGGTAATGFMHTLTGGGLMTGLGAAGDLMGVGQLASGLGMGLGTIAPYAAAAVAIYNAFKHKPTHHTGSVVGGTALGATTIGGADDPLGILNNLNTGTDEALRTLVVSTTGVLDTISRAFGGQGGFGATASFAADNDDASIGRFLLTQLGAAVGGVTGGANGGMREYVSNPEQAFAAYAADVAGTVRQALDTMNLPQWASDALAALGASPGLDQLTATAAQIAATSQALAAMGQEMGYIGGIFGRVATLSSDAQLQLAGFTGGIEQFVAKTQTYISRYYTEQEQAAISARRILEVLGQAGIAGETFDEVQDLRATMEGIGEALDTEAGRRQMAGLLNVAAAYADVGKVLEETGLNLADLAAGAPAATAITALTDPTETTADATTTTAEHTGEMVTSLASTVTLLEALRDSMGNTLPSMLQAGFNATVEAMLQAVQQLSSINGTLGSTGAAPTRGTLPYTGSRPVLGPSPG